MDVATRIVGVPDVLLIYFSYVQSPQQNSSPISSAYQNISVILMFGKSSYINSGFSVPSEHSLCLHYAILHSMPEVMFRDLEIHVILHDPTFAIVLISHTSFAPWPLHVGSFQVLGHSTEFFDAPLSSQ